MLTVSNVIERFKLEIITGETGIHKPITSIDVSRPGLEIAGYFSHYSNERVQLFGMTETTYFNTKLTDEERATRAQLLCTNETPCFIFTDDLTPPKEIIEACENANIPLLKTSNTITNLMFYLTDYLEISLAPETNVHGVLLDVYGIGVLITGESGIGKSEIALELVKNGHRLVADDNVEIKEIGKNVLIGKSPELIENLLEIRGLGIINVMTLFGASVVLSEKRIMLNVHLEFWQQDKEYDRLGLDKRTKNILNSEIPSKLIPVRPGRNVSNIIEVAAMDFRLQNMGVSAAREFNERLIAHIRSKDNGGK
ncbi:MULTISPECIES: HPr(Ser) kinase/phosphatase [unclassified Nosocomiicoccus]|uniref:HPr(Ser) kinase/phosphatase n=1 Tax=unclassified Nosocomiicoccus TaxID=2646683 RepID=UPI0008A2073E|nr:MULTISPECIES: HPr(Ser) kinase/phosphatase [unclassified Nosocomiicoccus]OFO53034.1 HPr kinase/phosphorylase [Nosocomiicoccus sp. HMSC059G07]OFS62857.1 HPr kinase/phosphorylase [Nosocomiicoccus sp. HMSC09A07]